MRRVGERTWRDQAWHPSRTSPSQPSTCHTGRCPRNQRGRRPPWPTSSSTSRSTRPSRRSSSTSTRSLLGWTFQDYGGGDQPYWVIDTGEGAIGNVAGEAGLGINGGLTQRQGPRPEVGAPVNGCNIVIGVEDVDELMRRGVELGGTEALPATDWPGIGRGGYLLDPDGNVFGLLSPVLSDGTIAMGAGAEA